MSGRAEHCLPQVGRPFIFGPIDAAICSRRASKGSPPSFTLAPERIPYGVLP